MGNVIQQVQSPAFSMEQSREAVIRAGEAHCQRFNDPVVCHEKKWAQDRLGRMNDQTGKVADNIICRFAWNVFEGRRG